MLAICFTSAVNLFRMYWNWCIKTCRAVAQGPWWHVEPAAASQWEALVACWQAPGHLLRGCLPRVACLGTAWSLRSPLCIVDLPGRIRGPTSPMENSFWSWGAVQIRPRPAPHCVRRFFSPKVPGPSAALLMTPHGACRCCTPGTGSCAQEGLEVSINIQGCRAGPWGLAAAQE